MLCPRRAEVGSLIRKKGEPEPQDEWQNDKCSYCGSLSSEEFFRRVEAGEKLSPTDKNYKVYVGPGYDKFYFKHLSESEQYKFAELWNNNTMQLGHPGYFYVKPFFIRVLLEA